MITNGLYTDIKSFLMAKKEVLAVPLALKFYVASIPSAVTRNITA